jgi:hypothetical protein
LKKCNEKKRQGRTSSDTNKNIQEYVVEKQRRANVANKWSKHRATSNNNQN